MHRTNHVPQTTFWMHMLSWGLAALVSVGSALAQERVAPRAREIDETEEYPDDLFALFVEAGLTGHEGGAGEFAEAHGLTHGGLGLGELLQRLPGGHEERLPVWAEYKQTGLGPVPWALCGLRRSA